ncbi:ECF-type sigma factor [Roseiconus lacunae]|uniref:ECF-type sigma factor n=1 Tax=Roseiconus lacunae TaxID=2605694 RepID=A0ABT7PQ84_9BACT|nr:ECF-type sigma factor [Roseiconus lacunae]MDM4018669.1 ECF-type sigma factor [Roseiconus lacunae]
MKTAVPQSLQCIDLGKSLAVSDLFPKVYAELRLLAAARMAHERGDHTLQTTGLVHEAFMRLAGQDCNGSFETIPQFFAAAAEAMRRILIDHARKRNSLKRGGAFSRVDLSSCESANGNVVMLEDLLDLDGLLEKLKLEDPVVAQLVSLRVYAGLSVADASKVAGVSRSTGYQLWDYALSWFALEREPAEAEN